MEEKTNFFEKFWYLFVILAVILVGVVGSLWFLNQKAMKTKSTTPSVPIAQEEVTPPVERDAQTVALESQSETDDIETIEADLQATNLSNLDKEMADIEAEISTQE